MLTKKEAREIAIDLLNEFKDYLKSEYICSCSDFNDDFAPFRYEKHLFKYIDKTSKKFGYNITIHSTDLWNEAMVNKILKEKNIEDVNFYKIQSLVTKNDKKEYNVYPRKVDGSIDLFSLFESLGHIYLNNFKGYDFEVIPNYMLISDNIFDNEEIIELAEEFAVNFSYPKELSRYNYKMGKMAPDNFRSANIKIHHLNKLPRN